MKKFIVIAAGAAVVTLSTIAQAHVHNDPAHFTREYARQALAATSAWVDAELRGNVDAGAPALNIEQTGGFGLDHSADRVETHASNSSSTSSLR